MLTAELHSFISSVGWALIHFLWQGTLITAAYWVITRNLDSVHAKYWTGMAMVVVSLLVPIINASSSTTNVIPSETISHLAPVVISHQQISYEGLLHYLINASLPYLVMIWAATVVFLSVRLARSWIHLASIRHECDPNTSRQLKQYIKNIAIKLDLPSIPLLKISREVMVPAAYGLFKPTVLLPLSLINQIPKDQLEAIIKHELCHLKRNDFIHNIIQLCADILLFFHPGIKWMNNDIRHIREQCCDQMVLDQDTEKLTYAKALTNIAAFSNSMKLKPSVHLGINDGMLLNRVKFLLQNNSSQSSLMVFIPFLMLFIFMIIMLKPAGHELELPGNTQVPMNQISGTNESSSNNQRRLIGHQFFPQLEQQPAATEAPVMTTISQMGENQLSDEMTQTTALPTIDRDDIRNDMSLLVQLPENVADLTSTPVFSGEAMIEDSLVTEAQIPALEADFSSAEPVTETLVSSEVANELSSFEVSNSIKPEFKRYIAPEYPKYFWYNQIEQDVIATFKINTSGRAYDIEFTSQINNYVAFEIEVEKAMKRWKFDTSSLNNSTLQRTYQQIFSFAISEEIVKNCEQKSTGTRLSKPMPCNK